MPRPACHIAPALRLFGRSRFASSSIAQLARMPTSPWRSRASAPYRPKLRFKRLPSLHAPITVYAGYGNPRGKCHPKPWLRTTRQCRILRGVDLEVPYGSSVALLGPSGSGKSSLMAVLAGLERASGGTVLVDGLDFTKLGRRRVGAGAARADWHCVAGVSFAADNDCAGKCRGPDGTGRD